MGKTATADYQPMGKTIVTERNHRFDLPAIRQVKGISLYDIADSTKISIYFLRAIEEGEFEKLPGGIYNTSYIRQYARAIDLEESKLLDYYRSRMPAES